MTIKEIDQAIEEGQSLKQIAQAYSEIANLKMKRIRAAAERNRMFFEEISYVYSLVKNIAIKKKYILPKPKQRLSIILTSNYRFYGTINSDLISFFLQQIQKIETDVLILGKAAIDYFKTSQALKNYQPILLKDDQPNPQELTSLISLIKEYNEVFVFYSKLQSLLVQEPAISEITVSSKAAGTRNQLDFKFIFEPELPKILAFFDSQILTLLLEQTFLESEVARTASRFISMDQAETEANKFIKDYQRLKAYTKRALDNNTILENFATMIAVREEE